MTHYQALLNEAYQAMRTIESTVGAGLMNLEEAMSNTIREVQERKGVIREVLRTVVSVEDAVNDNAQGVVNLSPGLVAAIRGSLEG